MMYRLQYMTAMMLNLVHKYSSRYIGDVYAAHNKLIQKS
jgi:hypothetical protein